MTLPCTLQRLTERVYWLTPDSRTDRPALGAIVGANGTLMVDAGNLPPHVELFLKALAAEGIPTPRYVALTHWHWDHVFGAAALRGIPIFAHHETARQIKIQVAYDWSDVALDRRVENGLEIAFCRDMIKTELPDRSALQIIPPDVLFCQSLTIDLGDITCEITHVGGDHSADSCIIHIPEDRVLFLGDCHYPNIHSTPRYFTPDQIFPLLQRLLSYDAEYYVEGHSEEVMTRAALQQFERDLKTVCEVVARNGANRETVLRELQPDYPDLAEIDWAVDAFIAGLAVSHA